jgi:hypothetical protein
MNVPPPREGDIGMNARLDKAGSAAVNLVAGDVSLDAVR